MIECLVAIAVIGVTTAAIGPMMVFSVATRIQNQRAEQALQIAQAEIDKARLIVELGGDYRDDLLAIPLPSTTTTDVVRNIDAPTAFESTPSNVTTVTDARLIDLDGDGDDDYAVQLFRTEGVSAGSTPVFFDIGARVYDARRSDPIVRTLSTATAGLTFTSGEGQAGTRPLAVIYSQISQGDREASLCQQWEYLSTASSAPSSMVCD